MCRVRSLSLFGIDALPVEVEVDVGAGLPRFSIVGLPDAAVQEARERVRVAISNSSFKGPTKKVIVNLAPANLRKEGPAFDLPIALAVLAASGVVPEERLDGIGVVGELSFDGGLRGVRGTLSMAEGAKREGLGALVLPEQYAPEAARHPATADARGEHRGHQGAQRGRRGGRSAGGAAALPRAAPHHLHERARGRREQPASRRGLARPPRGAVSGRVSRVQPRDARGIEAANGRWAGDDLAGRRDVDLPGRFTLVCSMNPCPCGYSGDRRHACRCSAGQIERYQSRISGPLLDRIDLFVDVPRLTREELRGSPKAVETSGEIRTRVVGARKVQLARGGVPNVALAGRKLRATCALGGDAEALFSRAIDRIGLSGRAHDRVLRVARTIADLAGEEDIAVEHVAEALNYRRAVAVEG